MSNSIKQAFSALDYFTSQKEDPQKYIRVVDNILLMYFAVLSCLEVSSSLLRSPISWLLLSFS